ncbi:Fic family protein [Aquifex aeolicus]|uniref:Probable protein adenylyltransferase aq_aa38 n=1 Tax=Aquifex aeolicus (strain VF5) TaxID=224324 RepID=YZ38_AQUAE|nr:Fic family protein [Aquifex aeolicus]O66426.1 RecName: Full=Probable protein adenylyltransferase aq_aa38 [Aquifex aeolicus VF5]AAC07978.1 putative protein [Aquifex aeolicus VF5]
MTYQNGVEVLLEEFLDYLTKEETICSLEIEKLKVSIDELEKETDEPRVLQGINYFRTAKEVYQLSRKAYETKEEVVSEALILWIYENLWKGFNVPKGYRKSDMVIFGAKFSPPPPYVVPNLIRTIVNWLRNEKTIDVVKKSIIFHTLFEVIHPFPDGNGRVGRILLNAILVENGLLNVAFRNREKYISALREAEEGAIVVVEKLSRGRKIDYSSITETVEYYGNLNVFDELIRTEMMHSLKVYSNIKQVFLTPEEAAKLLGLKNKDYVRVLIHRGKLKAVKEEGKWKIPLSEVVKNFEHKLKGEEFKLANNLFKGKLSPS